ncbi:hypothetical protein ES703_60170 [subsurface metagenome]
MLGTTAHRHLRALLTYVAPDDRVDNLNIAFIRAVQTATIRWKPCQFIISYRAIGDHHLRPQITRDTATVSDRSVVVYQAVLKLCLEGDFKILVAGQIQTTAGCSGSIEADLAIFD